MLDLIRTSSIPRKGLHRETGFTFHEALLAIALIGILGAIALPLITHSQTESRLRVLRSNLHQMNDLLREGHRFGAKGTTLAELKGNKPSAAVSDVCAALTTARAVFVDGDDDNTLDSHEFAFAMDLPPNADPYTNLVGRFLIDGYDVLLEGDSPVQFAIYLNGALLEIP